MRIALAGLLDVRKYRVEEVNVHLLGANIRYVADAKTLAPELATEL